jgi:predicted NAD/FAD-binding protein
MKIAVIGSGISGLSAAYYLSKSHKVDLFEKQDHFGGHAYTLEVDLQNKIIPVDIGFIVFNYETYPNLISFFQENKIKIEKSDMSFSVSVKDTNIEYCGRGIDGIFSNRSNLFNIKFIKMFFEIISFYKKSNNLNDVKLDLSLGEFLNQQRLSKYFVNYHLIPMVSAIWSMPPYEANQMPLSFFLKFFQNHGLFKIKDRPQWYTVSNRSKTYVDKILKQISGEYFKNYKINRIKRYLNGAQVYYGNDNEFFSYDKVIIATHADEALKLIEKPTEEERTILSNFKYKENIAYIHFDENIMPKNKKNWCSWNSSVDELNVNNNSVTYWLNLLQNLKEDKNIFLTLNPYQKINEEKIFKKVKFTHPYYDQNTLINQKNLSKIQNKESILLCGSYFGYGFHEDGIKSSLNMLKYLND